jgi:O-antigen/teichoic acid export membrane protein
LRFIRDTLTTFSAQIASVLLGIAATIVIARVLGPSGNGAYALVILVPTLLALVGNLGIGISNLYFGGKKKYDFAQLASNSLISALILGLLSSAAFLAYSFVFRPSFLSEVEPLHVVLAVAMVPFSLLTSYLAYILLGQGRIRQYNLLQVAPRASSLALILVLLLAFRGEVLAAVAAWCAGILVTVSISVLLVLKATRIRWSFQPRVFKDSLRFGVQGYLGNVFQFLNYRVDMLMVAYFMSVSYVGYYSIAVSMAEALWYFPGAVGTIVLARTPGMAAEEANRTTPRICRTTLFVTILAGLTLFGLGRYFIMLLFGSEFLPALKPLWYLLPGVAALSICKVLSNELVGRGKPIINAVVAGISLGVNIPLNLLLIPRMGIAGAALASTVSYSVSAVVTLVAFTRVSGNSWFDTLIIKPEDVRLYAGLCATLGHRIRATAASSRE